MTRSSDALITDSRDYGRIECAIRYLEDHYREHPSLDEIAASVGLSPFHFQRLFTRWAGVSPKQFLSFLTVDHAKAMLEDAESVLETAYDAGLSGPGRLHDLFVTLEAVTPGEYKAMGDGLAIRYGWHAGPFGEFLLATTERGVCALSFVRDDGRDDTLAELRDRWPGARIARNQDATAPAAIAAFGDSGPDRAPLRVWVKGSGFRVKVWQALLRLPMGRIASYGDIARWAGNAGAARAVGGALAGNPVAWLIPCHRVVRASGRFETDYRWGSARKRAMIAWEAARAP